MRVLDLDEPGIGGMDLPHILGLFGAARSSVVAHESESPRRGRRRRRELSRRDGKRTHEANAGTAYARAARINYA